MPGKLPPEIMERIVYRRLGTLDQKVLVGPAIGEDAAIIDLDDGRVLVVHSDAISGASEFLGWLAIQISANDIAVRGAKPRWFLMSLFLPEGSPEELIDKIMDQVDKAAREIGMMVVGGHTETTLGLRRPIIGTTAIGITERDKAVRTGGAEVGDYLIMTKTAAIEGTAILCTDFANLLISRGIESRILKSGSEFLMRVSVVREALALAEEKLATAMHDPTEGGILSGVAEIAYASRKTVELWADKVPLAEETKIVAEALKIDALKLISSGALIATVSPNKLDDALRIIKKLGINVSVIGRVKEYSGHLVEVVRGSSLNLVRDIYILDELFRLWAAQQAER